MVLVDTSVWVGHFRKRDPELAELLNRSRVLMHPFVLGELACGVFKSRAVVLSDLASLPAVGCATHEEALGLIEDRKLWGQGIGWIDAHLLASALLRDCEFWTLDEKLGRACGNARVKLHGLAR